MRLRGMLVIAALLLCGAAPPRPLYYDRPITQADLDGRSLRELSLMRNWIYARMGNPFRKRWLHDYFAAQSWYHELPAPELQKLGDVDRTNAALVEKAETNFQRAELQRRRDALLAAHRIPNADFSFLQFTSLGVVAQAGPNVQLLSLQTGEVLASTDLPRGEQLLWARPSSGALTLLIAQELGIRRGTWKLGAKPVLEPLFVHDDVGEGGALSSDDDALVDFSGEIYRVDLKKRTRRDTGALGPSRGDWIAWTPDGARAVVPTGDGAQLFSTSGKPKRLPKRADSFDDALALSPDGTWLLGTAPGHKLRRSTLAADAKIELFGGEDGEVLGLGATNDGDALVASAHAIARYGPSIMRWRTPFQANVRRMTTVGARILVATSERALVLLDANTGARIDSWHGPSALEGDDGVEMTLLLRQLGERAPSYLANRDNDRNPLDDVELLDQQLAVAQLRDLSRRDLKLLRHTISARRGKPFSVPLLHDYFATKSWYRADAAFTDAKLTELDKRNLKVVSSLEDNLGGPLPDNQEHEVIEFRG